jgi:hypothetical protein
VVKFLVIPYFPASLGADWPLHKPNHKPFDLTQPAIHTTTKPSTTQLGKSYNTKYVEKGCPTGAYMCNMSLKNLVRYNDSGSHLLNPHPDLRFGWPLTDKSFKLMEKNFNQ